MAESLQGPFHLFAREAGMAQRVDQGLAPVLKSLEGQIWLKFIPQEELADHQERFDVISTRLKAGRTVIHVLAEDQPCATFQPLSPDLEDVYFSTLFTSRKSV